MVKLHHFILLVALSMDGGTVTPQPDPPKPDAGTAAADSAGVQGRDGGACEPRPAFLAGTPWPEKPRLLATLDGRAIIAARAGIWELTDYFVKYDKRFAGSCDYSPKAMDVVIFEAEGMYVVRLDPRVDRCGRLDPAFNNAIDPAMYAVSPEGKILMEYPYRHEVPLVIPKPLIVNGIRWPEEARLLTMLDGRAIVAANAAVWDVLERFARMGVRFSKRCDASAKAMEVLIFEAQDMYEARGIYIVRVNPRVDRCEGADPIYNAGLGSALYAVSPEGTILGRVPSVP
jgi:hypothetical protein